MRVARLRAGPYLRVALGTALIFPLVSAVRAATGLATEGGLPIFQSYSAEDYRSHNEVTAVARGRDGTMYFGSIVSLLAFDGREWRKHGAATPWVWAVLPAGDGRIYVAGESEFGCFEHPDGGEFAYRSLSSAVPAAMQPLGWMRSIVERPDGVYFSSGRGVIRWREGEVRAWPMDEVRMTTLLPDGNDLYVHHPGQGLFRFAGEELQLVSRAPELGPNQRSWIARLDERTLLLGLFRAGILRLDGGRLVPWPNEAQAILAASPTTCGRVLRDGSLAVGTATQGLLLLSPEGRLLQHFDEAAGLNQNTVFSVAEDGDGGLWMTTRNGIVRWDPTLRATRFDERNGYPPREPVAMVRHAGRLFVVQIGGQVLELVTAASGTAAARFEPLPGVPGTVYFAASHPEGLLLAADGGLTVWDGRRALEGPRVRGVLKRLLVPATAPQRVFIGTDWGVHVVECAGGAWSAVAEWPLDAEVQDLAEDLDGSVWVGLSGRGYARLPAPPPAGSWAGSRPVIYDHGRGLPADHAWFLARTTPLGPLFNSEKDSFRFDASLDRMVSDERLRAPDGTRMFAQVQAAAPGGILWASGSRPGASDPYAPAFPFGFFRADGGSLRWRDAPAAWRRLVGAQGPFGQFAEPGSAGVVLWAASATSLLRFEYADPDPPPRSFAVELEAVVRDGEVVPAGTTRLPHSRRPMQFRFGTRRYDLGADVRFETRLVGFDAEWSEPSASRSVTYPALGGRSYVFEVRGRDGDGNLSDVARRTLRVAAPPYLAWWAWALYAIAAAGLFQAALRRRLRHAQAETSRLEALVAERTRDLALAKGAAEQANQAKSRFLANMSHELRTPLNAILGFAQILGRDAELSERNRERLRVIRSSGDHLLGLIDDVLDLAKVEAGRIELRPTPFSLPDLLRDLEAAFGPRAAERGIRLDVSTEGVLHDSALGDAGRLRQVLDNLLSNALKFTREGSVRLSVRAGADARCRFEVADTGAGIRAEDLGRLFRPFEQAADGRPPEPGAGLGLSIAQRLVELMGGRIEAESTPGRGSRFRFEIALPAAEAQRPAPPTRSVTGYRGRRRHLLVVDDLDTNRRVLRELLELLGFAVAEAASGEAALVAAGERPFDLALVDLRMPAMSGFELAARLRSLHPGTRIVATSAGVFASARDDALRSGADDYLSKPFQEAQLVDLLTRWLGLEWSWDPLEEAAVPALPPDSAAPQAAAEDLAPLREAARRGDVVGLRQALAALRARRPELAAFVEEIEALASRYQMEAIRGRLAQERPAK
jgi:signal transduction histidine kinase/CheY-like chemotaxis protein